MTPDRTPITGRSPPDRRPIDPRSSETRLNGRSAIGRRVRTLIKGYSAALGHPQDAPTMALITAAAEAVTLAEVARAECLGGMTGLNSELMIRLENTAARSLRRIGLNKPVPVPRKTFHEKMAEREAAQKAAEAKADAGGAT